MSIKATDRDFTDVVFPESLIPFHIQAKMTMIVMMMMMSDDAFVCNISPTFQRLVIPLFARRGTANRRKEATKMARSLSWKKSGKRKREWKNWWKMAQNLSPCFYLPLFLPQYSPQLLLGNSFFFSGPCPRFFKFTLTSEDYPEYNSPKYNFCPKSAVFTTIITTTITSISIIIPISMMVSRPAQSRWPVTSHIPSLSPGSR